MSDMSAPQPGWYADPENPAGERWWNGSGWSDHKRDSTETATTTPAAGAASFTVAPLAPTLGGPPPAAEPTGFIFGTPTPVGSDPRPDPYAPPAQGVATPYYSSPYVGAPYGAPAYGSGINGLALAGVITSAAGWLIVPVVGPIAGIILSVFGLRTARQREAAGNPNSGRGLAMAGLIVGIIIGAISALIAIVYIVAIIAAFSSPTFY